MRNLRLTALALGAGYLWALNPSVNVVAQIDPVTTSILRTVPVGRNPVGVAFGEGSVWVASQDGTLTRIDPQTGSGGQIIGYDLRDVASVRLVGATPGDVLEADVPGGR